MIDKNEITRHLQDWIDQMERSGKHVDLDDMNRHLGDIMHVQNAAPKPHFNTRERTGEGKPVRRNYST